LSGHRDYPLPGNLRAICDRRQDVFVGQPRILVEQFGLGHVLGKKVENERDPYPGPLNARFAAANSRIYGDSLEKRIHAIAPHALPAGFRRTGAVHQSSTTSRRGCSQPKGNGDLMRRQPVGLPAVRKPAAALTRIS